MAVMFAMINKFMIKKHFRVFESHNDAPSAVSFLKIENYLRWK